MTADENAGAEATVEQVHKMLTSALAYKGTLNQQRAYLLCQTLQLDYEKLSPEDRAAVERIAKKSPPYTSAIPQRGKGRAMPPTTYAGHPRRK